MSTWQIDNAHTDVEFAIKHLMISTVKGRFASVDGLVLLDEEHPSQSHVEIRIGVASIDTREEKRDAHLRSADFFDAENYPVMSFVSRRIDGNIDGDFRITGDLTIRSVTREITLKASKQGQVTDPWGNEKLGFSATGTLDRRDFGLTWNLALEAGGILVGDQVRISIEAELARVAEEAAVAA